jgi:hypothetical protein
MNPRIRELAEQAERLARDELAYLERVHNRLYSPTEDRKIYNEKFAQLIVQECANVIADDDLAKDCGTFLMDSYAKGMRYSTHLIKEHFGVEQ